MKVDLEANHIRVRIKMWRDTLDLKIDMSPGNRTQLIVHRAKLLGNFVTTAQAWTAMLEACSSEGEAAVELQMLKEEVSDFKAWAEEGLRSLLDLAKE